jgi:hypothetical protein
MNPLHRVRTAFTVLVACLAGSATAVAVASDGGRHGDSQTGTTETTVETTTTGTTSTTTTMTTTTTGTTTPGPTLARAPRVAEIEADALAGRRFRLRAEVISRGARVTRVRFTYRGRTVIARRSSRRNWTAVVAARAGDRRGDVIRVRVRACAGSRCTTRTGTDEAGG